MKKMKNLFIALLVGMFMLPVMNAATDPDAILETFTIDGTNAVCEADNDLVGAFNCTASVSWNATKATIVATPKSGAELETTTPSNTGEVTLTGKDTSLNYVVKLTSDETKTNTYYLTITKDEAPTPELSGIIVKVGNGENLVDFKKDTFNYNVEVPYNTTEVTIDATVANQDFTIGGIPENNKITLSENGVNSLVINVTAGDKTTNYYVSITIAENPLYAEIDEELENLVANTDYLNIDFAGVNGKNGMFMCGKMLADAAIVDVFIAEFSEDLSAQEIVANLKKAMEKDPEASIVYSQDGKLTDNDIAAIKALGKEVFVTTESEVIWAIDGSKLTDADKGFNAIVYAGEEVKKEISDKINKLLDAKDNGLIIDFEHSGNLPKGTKVMISVDGRFAVGDELSLYYYNEKTGKLELAKKGLKVENYTLGGETEAVVFVPFEHCSSYVLLPAKNNAQTGVLNVLLYTVMALGSLAGIVFLLKKKAN